MVDGSNVDTISPCPFWFLYRKHWKQYRTAQRSTKGCRSFTMDISSTTIAGLPGNQRENPSGHSCERRQPRFPTWSVILQGREGLGCSICYYLQHLGKTLGSTRKAPLLVKAQTSRPVHMTARSQCSPTPSLFPRGPCCSLLPSIML